MTNSDESGIRITSEGVTNFQYRYCFNSKRHRLGIGKYPAMALVVASVRVEDLKEMLDRGIDPRRSETFSQKSRMVRVIKVVDKLNLVDLNAPGVMASDLGLNLEQIVTRNYSYTQPISAQIHAMKSSSHIPSYDVIAFPHETIIPE